MATVYHATCLDCRHEWSLWMGDGGVYRQLVCDACGECVNRPRFAPADTPIPIGRAALREYLRDGGEAWFESARDFDPREELLLRELLSHCHCGGQLRDGSDGLTTYRCPECKGARLELGETEVLID